MIIISWFTQKTKHKHKNEDERWWRDKSELKRKLNLLLCSTENLHNSTNEKKMNFVFLWVVREHDFILFRALCLLNHNVLPYIMIWYDAIYTIYRINFQRIPSDRRNIFYDILLKIFFIFPLKGFFVSRIYSTCITHITFD